MIWADMDFEERMQAIYRGTRDGLLVKQIARDTEATASTVLEFARANGLAVRIRVPGQKKIAGVRRANERIKNADSNLAGGIPVNPTFAKRVGCAPDSMVISSRPLFRNEAVD